MGAEGPGRVGLRLASGIGDGSHAGVGEDFETEVPVSPCLLVGLLVDDRLEEADDRVPVGEDTDAIGAASDLPV